MKQNIGISILLCIVAAVLINIVASSNFTASAHARDNGGGSGNGYNTGGSTTGDNTQQTTSIGFAILELNKQKQGQPNQGQPNQGQQTLQVTLMLSGLVKGSHAAHIHQGNCSQDGKVVYNLKKITADDNGNAVVKSTIKVKGLNSIPANSWYVNVHAGTDMKDKAQMASISCGNVMVRNDGSAYAIMGDPKGNQNAVVKTAKAQIGEQTKTILVTGDGLPIYYYTGDPNSVTNAWKLLPSVQEKPNFPNLPELNAEQDQNNNGGKITYKLTYNKYPLYTHPEDAQMQDQGNMQGTIKPTGQGNGWFLITLPDSQTQ
jgi:hypothetical protein